MTKELVENYMEENLMTKTNFRKICHLTPSQLFQVMNNNPNIKVGVLARVAKELGIEISEFFGKI